MNRTLKCALAVAIATTLSACPVDDDDLGQDADTTIGDTTVEDTVADTTDSDVADTTVEDTIVEDTTVEDTTVEDTTVDDTTVEDTTADDTTVEDTALDDTTADTTVECTGPCDCDQGLDCVGGACIAGTKPVLCCSQDGCTADAACVNADDSPGLCGIETSALFGVVVFNEVLIDGASDGDPNGDGESPDPTGDEFVELVNTGSAAADLAGATLVETDKPSVPRHTFGAGTTLAAGKAYVVFGGGTAPDDTAGATFTVANATDPGIPFGLSLTDAGDTIDLRDADGKVIARFAYGPDAPLPSLSDESYTRDPDLTGGFVPHSTATGDSTAIFSPGTRHDGTSF